MQGSLGRRLIGKSGPVVATGVNMYHFRDGQVVQLWINRDFLTIQREMGVFHWYVAGGLLVLVTAVVLAVYKPPGRIRYWAGRKKTQRDYDQEKVDIEGIASTPRWVKVFGFFIILLILIVEIMILIGGHAPGAH